MSYSDYSDYSDFTECEGSNYNGKAKRHMSTLYFIVFLFIMIVSIAFSYYMILTYVNYENGSKKYGDIIIYNKNNFVSTTCTFTNNSLTIDNSMLNDFSVVTKNCTCRGNDLTFTTFCKTTSCIDQIRDHLLQTTCYYDKTSTIFGTETLFRPKIMFEGQKFMGYEMEPKDDHRIDIILGAGIVLAFIAFISFLFLTVPMFCPSLANKICDFRNSGNTDGSYIEYHYEPAYEYIYSCESSDDDYESNYSY